MRDWPSLKEEEEAIGSHFFYTTGKLRQLRYPFDRHWHYKSLHSFYYNYNYYYYIVANEHQVIHKMKNHNGGGSQG